MADISADTIAEHGRAYSVNKTRVRYDGQVELGSENLFSNPDFRDFVDGEPENITLGAPEDPVGWGVLIRKIRDADGTWRADTEISHQDTGPLPMDRDYYYQQTDLVDGAPAQDATKRAKIAAPTSFHVRIEGTANSQLIGGYYGIAYGWIMAKTRRASNPNIMNSPFLTEPSPRAVYKDPTTGAGITGGQSIIVDFANITPPDGAVGMYIASTERHASANAALTDSTLYMQRRFDVRAGKKPESWEFNGPLRKGPKAPVTNQTYRGGFGEWGAPRWRRKHANHKLSGFRTKLCWQYSTEMGWSKPQSRTKEIGTGRFVGRKQAIFWRPVKRPTNAKMWRPLYWNRGRDTWYAMDPRPFDQWAVLHHTDPEHGPGEPKQAFEMNKAEVEPDATGIDGPDTAPDLRLGPDADLIGAGTYRIRTVFYDEDGNETAPSFAIDRKIALGQFFKISRPGVGNILYNSDGHEYEVTGTRASGWEYVATPTPGVLESKFTTRNTMTITDTTSTGTTIVAKSAWSDVPEDIRTTVPYTVRALVDVPSGAVGNFRIYLETRPQANFRQDTAPVAADFEGGVIPTNTYWEDTDPMNASRSTMGGTGVHGDVTVLRKWNGTAWTFPGPDTHNTTAGRAQAGTAAGRRSVRIHLYPNGAADPLLDVTADVRGFVNLPDYDDDTNFPGIEGRAQVRVVYAIVDPAAHAITDMKVHFLGKHAGNSYPRAFPTFDDPGDPDVEIPSEFESSNVAGGDDEPFQYRRQGICRIARVDDSLRPAALQGINMRFVEYWAQYGTPPAADHGLLGYTTPVEENTQYTATCYLEYRGVTNAADVLHIGSFDSRGALLETHGAMKSVPAGTDVSPAVRTSPLTFTTPEGTAFVSIFRSNFSDGFWRVGGFMLRQSATAGTYTNTNATSGSRIYKFDTGVPNAVEGSSLEFLGEVSEWLSGGGVYTDNDPASGDDYESTEPDTTVSFEFRTSPDDVTWGGTWYTDFADVPKQRYWEIRVTMTAEADDPIGAPTVSTASPLLDSVGIELIRPYSQLLRPDGKEYPMPIQVVNFPVPIPTRQREIFLSDNNTPRFNLRGRDLYRAEDFGLETYSDSAVRAAAYSAVRDEGMHIIEDYDANRIFDVWIDEPPRWAVDREIHNEWDPYYIHKSEGLNAYVTNFESLRGDPVLYVDE